MSTYFFSRHHNPVQRRLVLRRVAANAQITLPKGSSLRRVYFNNLTANAVTGGVKVGTTSGGTDVVTAQAVAANGLVDTPAAINALSKTDQILYVQPVTAWNGAIVDVVFEYLSVPFVETEYAPGSLNLDANVGKAHSSQ